MTRASCKEWEQKCVTDAKIRLIGNYLEVIVKYCVEKHLLPVQQNMSNFLAYNPQLLTRIADVNVLLFNYQNQRNEKPQEVHGESNADIDCNKTVFERFEGFFHSLKSVTENYKRDNLGFHGPKPYADGGLKHMKEFTNIKIKEEFKYNFWFGSEFSTKPEYSRENYEPSSLWGSESLLI